MKSKIGCFLVLGALPLVIYPFVLLANIMGLTGQRFGNESFIPTLISYAFYIATTAYPLVYLFCVGSAIIVARKESNAALGFAFAPIGYLLLLVGLGATWSFTGMGMSTLQDLQAQGNASQTATCAPSALVDGGDGLHTTGCGIIETGGAGTGVIGDTAEAHNWEFKVTSRYRITITVANDRRSCSDITILDSRGKKATGLEDHKPPICLDGMTTTSYYYFTPSGNDTYIIRVFAPKTPGRYSLKIQ